MEIRVNKTFFKSLDRLTSWKYWFEHAYCEIRACVKYHIFSKDFWHLFGVVLKSYPWQESYLLEIERAKIKEMANYIEKNKRFVGWEQVVRDMRICISLIGIILEEKPLFHFNGRLTFKENESGNYEVGHTPDFKYVCDVKVNTKNIDRFVDKEAQIGYLEEPHEFYRLKAKYLYHKIRYDKGDEWWD